MISLVPNGCSVSVKGPLRLSTILFKRPSEMSRTIGFQRPEGMYTPGNHSDLADLSTDTASPSAPESDGTFLKKCILHVFQFNFHCNIFPSPIFHTCVPHCRHHWLLRLIQSCRVEDGPTLVAAHSE